MLLDVDKDVGELAWLVGGSSALSKSIDSCERLSGLKEAIDKQMEPDMQ